MADNSRYSYEAYLNELGIPEDDKAENGGRIPASTIHYGAWLRRNDPIAFNVGYQDWVRDKVNPSYEVCPRCGEYKNSRYCEHKNI